MYIPDMTERFPEGMNGVDMTDSFFPSKRYGGYEPSYEEILEDERKEKEREEELRKEEKEKRFEVGDEYRVVGIYGGVTYYTVKEINDDRTQILLAEHWVDVDGEGERESEWHKLEMEGKHERALDWTSKEYGDFWIYAKEVD